MITSRREIQVIHYANSSKTISLSIDIMNSKNRGPIDKLTQKSS